MRQMRILSILRPCSFTDTPVVEHKHLKGGKILSLFHVFSPLQSDKCVRTKFNRSAEQVFEVEVYSMDLTK